MKTETAQNKLLALLGIQEEAEKVKEKKKVANGNLRGITEEEIQEFREVQGLIYFLQAPELFSAKKCKHCGADFIVSRLHVALCSYTCIKNSLKDMGIDWRRGAHMEVAIEEVIKHVYEGNEPIWIRNLERLRTTLNSLSTTIEKDKDLSEKLKNLPSNKPPILSSGPTPSPGKSKRQFT